MSKNHIGSVRFYKRVITFTVLSIIVISAGFAVYFGMQLHGAQAELTEKDLEIENLTAVVEEAKELELKYQNAFESESPYAELYPDFYAPQELNAHKIEKNTIYLTFDDGPSPRTEEILDILKEQDVKATFFVIASKTEEEKELLRRIVEEGHTLGMHTWSHKYDKIYASVEDYLADMYKIFKQIQDETGVTPTLFRFPGGSINGYNGGVYQELISEMVRRGFIPYDWNISSQDAAVSGLTPAKSQVENILRGAKNVSRGIVLMHDSDTKTTTVQAVAPVIEKLREQGFSFAALTPEDLPMLYAYGD